MTRWRHALIAVAVLAASACTPSVQINCPRQWRTIRTIGSCPWPEYHYTTITTTPWHHTDPQQRLWAT